MNTDRQDDMAVMSQLHRLQQLSQHTWPRSIPVKCTVLPVICYRSVHSIKQAEIEKRHSITYWSDVTTLVEEYRTELPAYMASRSEISFWSVLKQCIGKELSKITMPVIFNEPLSLIQRLAEYMEYSSLLEIASRCDDPIQRMETVAAFAVSAVSSNWGRIGKPFNPVLGETFELSRPEFGFRYVGEQVSHHPPVTAFNAEGTYYTFCGSVQPKLKFWGKSVDITPKGLISLTLHKYRETYTWQNVNCVVHNVMIGTLWVEHCGQMEINCNKSTITATIIFKSGTWFGKDLHHVEGFICHDKVKLRALYGNWILGLFSCSLEAYETFMKGFNSKPKIDDKNSDISRVNLLTYDYDISGQRTLWKATPRPLNSEKYYQFSLFSMSLNELIPIMNQVLPPTDSRFRSDIRSLEEGKLEQSASEKQRIEEIQRSMRDERKKDKFEWQPRWFTFQTNPSTSRDDWVFTETYWKRDWSNCVNLF